MLELIPRRAGGLVGALAALAGAGCGSTTSQIPRLSSQAAGALHQRVADVRAALTAQDRSRAQSALDGFSQLVDHDAAAGDFTAAELEALRTDIAQTRARIAVEVAAPAAAAATPTTPTQPAPGPQAPPGHGNGNGHGNGKGPGDGKGHGDG